MTPKWIEEFYKEFKPLLARIKSFDENDILGLKSDLTDFMESKFKELIEEIKSVEFKATWPLNDPETVEKAEILNQAFKQNILPKIIEKLESNWLSEK